MGGTSTLSKTVIKVRRGAPRDEYSVTIGPRSALGTIGPKRKPISLDARSEMLRERVVSSPSAR